MAKPKGKYAKDSVKDPKKYAPWYDEYFDMGFMCLKPVNDAYLDKLGEEFVKWCTDSRDQSLQKKERRFSYERWLEEKGISLPTMLKWRKRRPFLEESIKHGMMIIGNRLEEGMLTKELSEKAVLFGIHDYLERYDKANKYHDDRKKITDTIAALLGKTFNVGSLDESERPDEVDKDTK